MPDLIEIELLNIPHPFHAGLFPELSFLLDLHMSSQCPPNYPSIQLRAMALGHG